MRKMLYLALSCTLALAAGCNTSGSTSVACNALTPSKATPPKDWGGTVFTIVMENHSAGQIFGSPDAPFINQIAKQNAVAHGYHDSYVHPSEPNYIWMVSGENFGILNDNDPGSSNHIASTSHVADQIEMAGLTWKTYQESMGQPCGLTSQGTYAAKHNPFIYFDDINGWDGSKLNPTQRCIDHVVDYSQFDTDLAAGKLPNYVFITPNLQDDMHDGTVKQGDDWLAREVPKIIGSDAFNKGGVLFILWDEGGGTIAGDDPPFIAVSPNAKQGYVSQVTYDTSSYLKTVEDILGLQSLPCSQKADTVQAMDDLFTVPVSGTAQTGGTTPPTTTPSPQQPTAAAATAPAQASPATAQ
jgi:phospholipase C